MVMLPVRVKVDGDVIVRVVEPRTAPTTAATVVTPGAWLVARPALLMVATQAADEVHVAELLRSCVLLSAYVPVAMNCCVPARGIEGFDGVTATDSRATVITVN